MDGQSITWKMEHQPVPCHVFRVVGSKCISLRFPHDPRMQYRQTPVQKPASQPGRTPINARKSCHHPRRPSKNMMPLPDRSGPTPNSSTARLSSQPCARGSSPVAIASRKEPSGVEASRYRDESCANAFAWHYICVPSSQHFPAIT